MSKMAAFFLLISTFIFSPPSFSGGGGLTGGATEATQILNNAELIDVAIKEAENLAYTIRQYEIMYENFRNLPNHIKQQALADLQNLAQIVSTGRAVAYSSGQIDEDYRREYRDFEHYAQRQQESHDALAERYRNWSQSNHDSVRGALRAAGLQAQQFDREASALRSIELQMENAVGTKQLLQAGGSIAAIQVKQLQKLRQLQMAQIQLQASHVGGQVDRQAEDDSAWHRAVAPRDNNPDTQQPIQANDLF
ncbi:P-type conjugative transfer protein TrbJ [Marinobacterium stanieri]|uniref:P-type conjugative transfer protein TrbJ n=1 Tax=Marinobacterium stanieri TaxID=49186 RepID=A0A1N6XXF8_9GAMM|nr:P-type conjugative transfer protein TrbJ [Marinobacterium stanieri]SIR07095.1 P-type conjugative transfer protein TrbJ [Marinobacterium stanieri]